MEPPSLSMAAIQETSGLKKYLEKEEHAIAVSRRLHAPEFQLFCDLADHYERLGSLCRMKREEVARLASPMKLFQVVLSQMYGVGSQLLRRRIIDADALTRRAIEAAATAYRLWRHPNLHAIYEDAYPNHQGEDDPKQWKPSREYKKNFNTGLLFSEPEPAWAHLRAVYDAASAASTHTGPLATAFHEEQDGTVLLHFIEPENQVVRMTWNRMLDVYSEMLMVFLRILRESAEPSAAAALEQDLRHWRENAAKITSERQPI